MPEESTVLRDEMALVRTRLANERTVLAYVRTALAFAAVGGTLLKFFDDRAAQWAGWLFLIAGVATFAAGMIRFRAVRRLLRQPPRVT